MPRRPSCCRWSLVGATNRTKPSSNPTRRPRMSLSDGYEKAADAAAACAVAALAETGGSRAKELEERSAALLLEALRARTGRRGAFFQADVEATQADILDRVARILDAGLSGIGEQLMGKGDEAEIGRVLSDALAATVPSPKQ